MAITATACASVQVSVPGFGQQKTAEVAPHSERVALNEAAGALSEQPWGAEAQNGVISVLFGTIADNEQDRLIDDYLTAVRRRSVDPVGGVVADAEMSLFRARRVVLAGQQAADAITPVSSDIATLEAAIGEARECRRVYARALSRLADEGRPSEDAATFVREAFDDVIDDLADAADRVAEKAATAGGVDRFAQPVSFYQAR